MDKRLLLLIALKYAGERGLTPVQLQKSMFLLGQAYSDKLANYYNFEPYNYGPFDKTIYVDAKVLAEEGLVSIKEVEGHRWQNYFISAKGEHWLAVQEGVGVDTEVVSYLEKLVVWVKSLSFTQLVSAVYKKFPEYKVNSIFEQ